MTKATATAKVLALALALVATLATTTPARAEQSIFYTDNGVYRCEMDHQDTLGKIVCRNPRRFADYYVVYFQLDATTGRVFTDAFWPTGPGGFRIEQQNMAVGDFLRLYGGR